MRAATIRRGVKNLAMLPSYYRLIKSYEGKGNIHLSDGRTPDCDFECGQNEEGDIIVGLATDPSAVIEIFVADSTSIIRISGTTTTGQFLEAIPVGVHDPPAFLTAYAKTLRVGDSVVPINAMKAYLVNLEFISPFSWRFGGYDFAIEGVKEYGESVSEMHATKRPKMTAELTITPDNNHITDIAEVEHILDDTCLLLSLAKGCRIQWLYWDGYSDDKQVRSYHRNGWSSPFGDWPIILEHPPDELGLYLSQVFEPYRGVQKRGIWDFKGAINHFVDTVSSRSMLELKATNLVVLTDYLAQLFAKDNKLTYFVYQEKFADKKQSLQERVRELLKESFSLEDFVENEYMFEKKKKIKKPSKRKELDNIVLDETVQEVSHVIECINSRSFPSLLKRLHNHLNLDDEDELHLFVEIRNKLVHEASFLKENDFAGMGMPYERPFRQFCRVLALTSRTLLAILKYRGCYHDWLEFVPGESAGPDVSGRVMMPYVEE
jgi:hypothetical protein